MAKKKVLSGHKKVGSKFKPPGSGLFDTEISYEIRIIPEILWIGLICETMGATKGVNAACHLAKCASESSKDEKKYNFAVASSYSFLSDLEKEELCNRLDRDGFLQSYQGALAPLIVLYKDFPLRFIGSDKSKGTRGQYIENLKFTINKYFDKYDIPSLLIQALVPRIRYITGGLHLNHGMKLPDIDLLLGNPGVDEIEEIGSTIRIGALMEFAPMGQPLSEVWARDFWNEGYRLDDCDFPWEEENDNE